MTAQTYELVTNPWALCSVCEDEVHARTGGRNFPCGHAAPIESVCPTWDPFHGCRCNDQGDAEALQEAIEAAGYDVPAASTQAIDHGLLPLESPSNRAVVWLLVVFAVSVLALAIGEMGARW